ncbi:MAG: excinuclease ABC subunit UvrC [Candidatus Obscuribacterales bacterium]|nr:excinuclease ABC subunit UvrC [Candidatus Obscuribacterales bacterium]
MKTEDSKSKIYEQLASLPDEPGVYIFKDRNSEIIYIGKALSLKSRVRSYWNSGTWLERPKLAVLVPRVEDIETIITNSEKEALLLEATLVRKHMPRYNVHLKDDKKYPWLCITYDEPFPRLIMVRDPAKQKKDFPRSKVFGPYVETGLMWETVRVLRKVFPMRQRKKPLFKDRPCMNFHIGLCLGPCQNLVEESFYNQMVEQVELFLSGSQKQALDKMEKEMTAAAESLRFEEAAAIRDRLLALRSILEKQQVFFKDQNTSMDIISEAHSEKLILICLMRVREGKLIGSENFDLSLVEKTSAEEAYQSFIEQYYIESEDISIPKEVLLQHRIEDESLMNEILPQKAKRQVKIAVPERGDKLKLVEMAKKNASLALENLLKEEHGMNAKVMELLSKLQEELELSKAPYRIECFDISNIQGSDNVASMVVFENASAKKSDYRTFKIKSVEGEPNDFASMKEVVGRRYKKLKEENKNFPDLIIIDGGKGQLNAALEALSELEIKGQDIIGLAKKQEEVYKPGRSQPYLLPRRTESLHLLQRVRDEAHRFAVTFHRKLRAKRSLMSGFDELPGVGQARRKLLMIHFNSFERLKKASLDELKNVVGIPEHVAEKIYKHLHKVEESSTETQ